MRAFLVGLTIALALGLVGLRPYIQKEIVQPIQFNHKAHKEIECASCHESVANELRAGLPNIELCMTCHESALTKSPEEAKLRSLAGQGKGIQWQSLFHQPAHVFYSHRRHVGIAKLECHRCHGDIGETSKPPGRVRNLTMSECIACHEQNKVRADCIDCHR